MHQSSQPTSHHGLRPAARPGISKTKHLQCSDVSSDDNGLPSLAEDQGQGQQATIHNKACAYASFIAPLTAQDPIVQLTWLCCQSFLSIAGSSRAAVEAAPAIPSRVQPQLPSGMVLNMLPCNYVSQMTVGFLLCTSASTGSKSQSLCHAVTAAGPACGGEGEDHLAVGCHGDGT